MNLIRHTDRDYAKRLRQVTAPSTLFDPTIEERARVILQEVEKRGDGAVLELTKRFDGATLEAAQLAVTQAEWMSASLQADPSLRAAVAEADLVVADSAGVLVARLRSGSLAAAQARQLADAVLK